MPKFEFIAVFDENHRIILYDLYVDGKWIGSRRTPEQCKLAFRRYV